MSKAVVRKNHMAISSHKYFTGRAENVKLGTFGEMRKSPLFANYLDGQGHFPLPDATIEKPATVEIDFEKSKSGEFGANATYLVANGSVKYSYDSMKQGKLVLMKLKIGNDILKTLINSDKKLFNELLFYKNPRIVNQVFVIVEASFASEFYRKISFNTHMTQGQLTIDADGGAGSSGKSSLIISAGTVFAYGVVKPVFDKNKTSVDKLLTDQWGMG
jgi:hypothetical protein